MSETPRYFKVLGANGECCNGGSGTWSLPTRNEDGTWVPGEWMPDIEGQFEPCANGYHLCELKDIFSWLNARIFEAEFDGEMVAGEDKIVVRHVRLVRELNWNERTARLFAADCAERVLKVAKVTDKRSWAAVEVARKYANGQATDKELSAAQSAARLAARSAAESAAWSAARLAARLAARSAAESAAESAAWSAARLAAQSAAESAAESAARLAARSAAESAAESAARSAAESAAESAARLAARSAAWSAARSAAQSAARLAELEWQVERLRQYLDGEIGAQL